MDWWKSGKAEKRKSGLEDFMIKEKTEDLYLKVADGLWDEGYQPLDFIADTISLVESIEKSHDDQIWYLGEGGTVSLADLVVGAYWFAKDYYSGQTDPLYSLLCVLGRIYAPGPLTWGLDAESSEAEVYGLLIDKFEGRKNGE